MSPCRFFRGEACGSDVGSLRGCILTLNRKCSLKADKSKNMNAANVYAVMNVLSAAWTFIVVAATELSTIQATWDHTVKVIIRSHSVDLEIHG